MLNIEQLAALSEGRGDNHFAWILILDKVLVFLASVCTFYLSRDQKLLDWPGGDFYVKGILLVNPATLPD